MSSKWVPVKRQNKRAEVPKPRNEADDLEKDIAKYLEKCLASIHKSMETPSNLGGFKRACYEFEVTKDNRREAFLILGPQTEGEAYFDRMGIKSLIDRIEEALGPKYSINIKRTGPTTSVIDIYWTDIDEINETINYYLETITANCGPAILKNYANAWINNTDLFEYHIDPEKQSPEDLHAAKMISMFLLGNRVQRLGLFTDLGVTPLIDRIEKKIKGINPAFTVSYRRVGKTRNIIYVKFNREEPINCDPCRRV